jgi:hypothetical protein
MFVYFGDGSSLFSETIIETLGNPWVPGQETDLPLPQPHFLVTNK